MTEDVSAELARLQAENSHLKAILRQHGITWGSSLSSAPPFWRTSLLLTR